MSRTKTRSKTQEPPKDVAATLKRLEQKDPGLGQFLKKAYGHAVFPSVGKAALVIGGAYGHGEVFEGDKHIGHATMGQTTLGVQVGGDTFSEVIAFENEQALERFKQGKIRFAANASAVMVKAGAAATANYEKGVAVFAYASGGMLLELSIGGQKFKFKPASENGEKPAKDDDEPKQQDEQGEQDQQRQPRGLLRGAASKATGLVTNHPFAAATVGLVAGFFVLRALYRVGLEDLQNQRGGDEGDEGDGDEGGQDNEAENQQQQNEDDDDEDQDDLHSMRRKRSMA